MSKSPPNIFKYATTELSQDAMICWLVDCARVSDGGLRKCGTEFIRTLWNHGGGDGVVQSCAISDVSEPERQYGQSKIDVYFEATVNGMPVRFAVEDKRDTEMHEGQLAGHAEAIGEGDEVRLIYYKTGYVFDLERQRANEAGFAVFSAEDMLAFLNGLPVRCGHELLRQYGEWLTYLIDMRNARVRDWDFTQDFVQFEFMRTLMRRLLDSLGTWQEHLNEPLRRAENDHSVTYGRNLGGAGPWTQYWFCNHLFWRVDAYQPLRLRVWTESAQALGDWDTEVWQHWIELFQELQDDIQTPGADFNVVMHRDGDLVSEGTIGAIDIRQALLANGGDLEETVDSIVWLHCEFIERITALVP